MAALSGSAASLRFFGDDLDHDELTKLLGCPPTKSERKGEEIVGKVTGQKRIARGGGWRLSAERRGPGDFDDQISEILDRLTDDMNIWQNLTSRYRADIFCGLFMKEGNEGVSLSNETLQRLAERGLTIDFDIYDSSGK
ncbi:DUF4279 domain-containing protein [Ruegeria sp. A3M17]|uniref:DUF4279 domain-containing protein n=1 Tax=Ruegeria sp. A3M17 TaxID=2267229 RepID=UPI000DEB7F28|nr:DUF4279 domain-containing protein [Ruegeria sp. A3M17]RBW63343.1 hypothetical protein DS906_00685 [Ruegeria sp. A3M17]